MNTRLADGTKGKPLRWMLALVLNLSLLSACTPGAIKPTPMARAVPAASATELDDLVGGNTAFTFDLYQALRTETDGNFLYSIQAPVVSPFCPLLHISSSASRSTAPSKSRWLGLITNCFLMSRILAVKGL